VEAGAGTNKSMRHLPYKDASGKIDLPHLRNAIARIPQMKGISDSLKASLQAKARKLLGGSNKAASENQDIQDAYEMLMEAGYEVGFSETPYERSDPGTGPSPIYGDAEQPDPGTGQFIPRVSQDPGVTNKAIAGGWRRDPLPLSQSDPNAPKPNTGRILSEQGGGGNNLAPFSRELAQILGLQFSEEMTEEEQAELETKIKEKTTIIFSEHKALKDAVSVTGEEKQFAEQFPTMWREHQTMLDRDRDRSAVQFSESVKTVLRPEGDKMIPTTNGLSAAALEKVTETHKKFAEGRATIADFEETVTSIVNGGIVQYGEVGSSQQAVVHDLDTRSMAGLSTARKLFAEKVTEVQMAHKGEENFQYKDAVKEAAQKYPEIAAAYRMSAPA
jgi:hypothetical protein